MRFLLRMLVFWAIVAPLLWVFGVPYLLRYIDQKTQAQNTIACREQLATAGLDPASQRATRYCACLNETLHFKREDLFEIAKTRQAPERMTAALQVQVETCSPLLDSSIPLKQPDKTNADGSIEIQL